MPKANSGSRTSKLQEVKANGNEVQLKEGRKDERKKWMRAVPSKQRWQPEQGVNPQRKAVVKHVGPHSPPGPHVSNTSTEITLWGKRIGEADSLLITPS